MFDLLDIVKAEIRERLTNVFVKPIVKIATAGVGAKPSSRCADGISETGGASAEAVVEVVLKEILA